MRVENKIKKIFSIVSKSSSERTLEDLQVIYLEEFFGVFSSLDGKGDVHKLHVNSESRRIVNQVIC